MRVATPCGLPTASLAAVIGEYKGFGSTDYKMVSLAHARTKSKGSVGRVRTTISDGVWRGEEDDRWSVAGVVVPLSERCLPNIGGRGGMTTLCRYTLRLVGCRYTGTQVRSPPRLMGLMWGEEDA